VSDAINIQGFKDIADNARPIMTLGTHGAPRTGKTRFAATAPDPIGWLPVDRNSRWTANATAKKMGKRIVIPDKDLVRVTGDEALKLSRMPVADAIKFYRKYMDDFKGMYFRLLENKKIRTVVIDTATQVFENVLFANYGRNLRIMPRDRGAANQEMRDLIAVCDKNLILIHQSKQVWVNNEATDKFEMAGWPHLNFAVNCCIEHGKLTKRSAIKRVLDLDDDDDVPNVLFKMNVYDSQANPMLAADTAGSTLYGKSCTFQELGVLVHPDSESEDWS